MKSKARRIYIRHANKEYVNGDARIYKHDPGITSQGVEKAKMVAKHLVEQWGIPDKIFSSPYRRARETAKVMKTVLDIKIPIFVDREVSEYLGNHRNETIDVTESTLVHHPPHPETFSDMKKRVQSHHDKITKKSHGVIWIITHGIIMKQEAELVGIKMKKDFPSLTCLSIVDSEENITKGEVILFHDSPDHTSEGTEQISDHTSDHSETPPDNNTC